MPKSKESIEHIKVVEWIKANEGDYPELSTIYHVPNSFFGTGFGVIQWLKKLGMRKGIYDLIIPISKHNYCSYWIEFKAPGKKLTPDQKQIPHLINTYSDLPVKYEIFYDADSCIQSIKEYLTLSPFVV